MADYYVDSAINAEMQKNYVYLPGNKITANFLDTGTNYQVARRYVWECTTGGTSDTVNYPSWAASYTPNVSIVGWGSVSLICRLPDTWARANNRLYYLLDTSPLVSPGDRIFVKTGHSELMTSERSFVMTNVGTINNWVQVLCVDGSGNLVTTPSATVNVSNSHLNLQNGYVYFHGIHFKVGTDNAATYYIRLNGTSACGHYYNNCQLNLACTNGGNFDMSSATIRGQSYVFDNTVFRFKNINQFMKFFGGRVKFLNTARLITSDSSIPTTLALWADGYSVSIDMNGVGLHDFISGKTLFNTNYLSNVFINLVNCRMHADVTLFNSMPAAMRGIDFNMDNCHDGANNYTNKRYRTCGSVITESVLVMTGGASDGTTPISCKVVTSSNANLIFPMECPPIYMWNESTGSPQTVTVEILHDSATNLKDDEVWLELEYLGSASYPISSFVSDKKILTAAAANQTASAATWTTTGMSNPNTQKLSVTFTPEMKGLMIGRVYVGKASYTVYINPQITVS